jgi:uncharacterized protein
MDHPNSRQSRKRARTVEPTDATSAGEAEPAVTVITPPAGEVECAATAEPSVTPAATSPASPASPPKQYDENLQGKLRAAIEADSVKACADALDGGADADGDLQLSYCTQTALCYAASAASAAVCELLLERGANVDRPNNRSASPLLSALGNEKYENAELLLHKGANVDYQTTGEKWTALSATVTYGNAKMVRKLLEFEPDLNIAQVKGYTPLMLAVMHGYAEITSLLLEHKDRLDFTRTDAQGLTAAAMCKVAGYPNMLTLLRKAGVPVSSLLKHVRGDHGFCTPCADGFL